MRAGATDTFIHTLARDLQPALGQSVLVDNRPGGNFIIAADAVIKAEPDGHTLMAATSGHAVTEALGTNQARYRLLRDLVPVSTVNYIELILIAHPLRQHKTFQLAPPGCKASGAPPHAGLSVLGS
ncbi:MAG: tripartite tricarboxylate transporter substrate-binding protein [Pseudomonadota bacterium]